MIYISSSNIKTNNVLEAVEEIASLGFRQIELSGGGNYQSGLIDQLVLLKDKYSLSFRCHNYFPPPKKHFVLNLASSNSEVSSHSLNMIKEALDCSIRLGSNKYGIHAGFRLSPNVNELGMEVKKKKLESKEDAIERFCENLDKVRENFSLAGVELYIENNVLSLNNFKNFNENPFLLTSKDEYFELREITPFKLLLDVAHLKVTCNSLGLNFYEQMEVLVDESDYIHISDNDGLADTNHSLEKNSEMYSILKKLNLKGKTFTLEVYSGDRSIQESYDNLSELL